MVGGKSMYEAGVQILGIHFPEQQAIITLRSYSSNGDSSL
jgi:hypothetical protein